MATIKIELPDATSRAARRWPRMAASTLPQSAARVMVMLAAAVLSTMTAASPSKPTVSIVAPSAVTSTVSSSSAPPSTLSLGPHALQKLITEQLFTRGGRWYLIEDGGCYTYLESPRVRFDAGRVVMQARLSSKLGQSVADGCLGADFGSQVTVSGRLRGAGPEIVLGDIRIDGVDDDATRNALNLAMQLAPQALPRSASIDLMAAARNAVGAANGLPVRVDELRIANIVTRADAVVIQFYVNASAP